jgi:hypothetical protein
MLHLRFTPIYHLNVQSWGFIHRFIVTVITLKQWCTPHYQPQVVSTVSSVSRRLVVHVTFNDQGWVSVYIDLGEYIIYYAADVP